MNEPLLNVQDIVKRAKEVMNFRTDAALAEYLGISRPTLSNWMGRNSIDYPLFLEKMKHIDYTWLLTGKGKPEGRTADENGREVEIIHHPKSREPMDDRYVSLYNIHAAANLRTILTNKNQYIEGRILIPNIPACDGALRITGDSMYPLLKSGDIVGFKEIGNVENIIFGEIYLVSFQLDGDDYLTVKYVKRSEKEGYITLVSYNQNHEPMELPIVNIQAMGIVKFSIRKHVML
ncbi:MAG: transcriptional regulator [Bacteroides sp.]|nr:transcriptional regulator [Bacteroides sp.]